MKKIKTIKRRQFLQAAAVIPGASMLGLIPQSLSAENGEAKKLNILFLGGTGFIGPHMVRKCLSQGYSVTLFNRGKRNSNLFPGLETIIGNRDPKVDEGLKGLKGRTWDVVIDTSGYIPRHVAASAEMLKDAVDHYLFISTVSVYSDFSIPDMTEDAPLAQLEDPSTEQITGETYGGLKVLCEKAVTDAYGERATVLRPTFIIGPGDHTDRFIHYIHRPLQGGRMAVPGKPDNPISYIDVRDLAEFVEHAISKRIIGTYNVVNQHKSATFGQLLESSITASNSDVETTWIDTEFLTAQQKIMGEDYRMFPMWLDQDNPEYGGYPSNAKAVAAGLTYRPFEQTVTDTYKWWIEQPQERRDKRRDLVSQEFEEALLAAWDKRDS
ncbi:MAG: NAD-dependent epimerase/dehydratase family protein [Pseudomonadota bacterium]